MGRDYIDSARAAAEADRIISVAEQNLKQVLLSLKSCLQVVHMTQQMLEVDPECICVNSNGGESKWERRRELDKAADCIETGIEVALRNNALVELGLDAESDDRLVDRLVVQPKHGDDNNLLWCDRVCVYEKVDMDMDNAVWCNTPPTIMELVFARLPLDQLFRMRCLSKHWRDSIMAPSFQHAFGTTTSRRLAIVAGPERNGLWSFGNRERKWYKLPFNFLPAECDYPVAGDGGLLCCQDEGGIECNKNLYVCNPLTQAWRMIPLPLLPLQVLQEGRFDLVHMVTNTQTKQYTITVVSDLQPNEHYQSASAKAVVMVYDSATKTWSASNGGVFQSSGDNLVYYNKYNALGFLGVRVYNKTTGYSTVVPFDLEDDIISFDMYAHMYGYRSLAVYQGQVYVLRIEEAKSGIWILRSPSHVWEKLYSVPKPEVLKYYLFSIVVYADLIIVSGDKLDMYDDAMEIPENADDMGRDEPENPDDMDRDEPENPDDMDRDEPENPDDMDRDEPENPDDMDRDELEDLYFWMLDRAEGTWSDMAKRELGDFGDYISSQILLKLRLDTIP